MSIYDRAVDEYLYSNKIPYLGIENYEKIYNSLNEEELKNYFFHYIKYKKNNEDKITTYFTNLIFFYTFPSIIGMSFILILPKNFLSNSFFYNCISPFKFSIDYNEIYGVLFFYYFISFFSFLINYIIFKKYFININRYISIGDFYNFNKFRLLSLILFIVWITAPPLADFGSMNKVGVENIQVQTYGFIFKIIGSSVLGISFILSKLIFPKSFVVNSKMLGIISTAAKEIKS